MLLTKEDLYDYQKVVIDFAEEKKKCCWFLDMSLGKTAASLTVASKFLAEGFTGRVLIIAPIKVAHSVWKQEAEKWEHLKHLKINVCLGDIKKRRKLLQEKADIYVISKDTTEWFCNEKPQNLDCMLIVDEASGFKSPSSRKFKALKNKEFKSVVLLTGTPTPKGMVDLWSQIYLVDKGERLGKTFEIYLATYFNTFCNGNYEIHTLKGGAMIEIMDKIKDICISMRTKDYLKMPKKIIINKKVLLSPEVEEKCKSLCEEFFISLKDVNIRVFNGSSLLSKLLQFSNGFLYDKEGKDHFIHDEKIKAMREIIKENPNDNFFVAYQFKADLEAIKKAFPEAVELSKTAHNLKDWNAGKIKILLAHPKSAGHGLNAQFGGSIVIWFGLSWSLEEYEQFNARLYRQGQEKDVKIIHIKTNTDERVANVLSRKAMVQDDLMNYLKR